MDKINDNNATPTKRTGVKNDESLDTGRDKNKDTAHTRTPEIVQPDPASATPNIPDEMPARHIN
jgi:hypothetical protein